MNPVEVTTADDLSTQLAAAGSQLVVIYMKGVSESADTEKSTSEFRELANSGVTDVVFLTVDTSTVPESELCCMEDMYIMTSVRPYVLVKNGSPWGFSHDVSRTKAMLEYKYE